VRRSPNPVLPHLSRNGTRSQPAPDTTPARAVTPNPLAHPIRWPTQKRPPAYDFPLTGEFAGL